MPKPGKITTVVGTGVIGLGSDSKPLEAALNNPYFCLFSADGDLYIADTDNHAVRVLRKKNGKLETPLGDGKPGDGAQLNHPVALAFGADGSLYICERLAKRIRRLQKTGPNTYVNTVVAGAGFPNSAPAVFKEPHDVASDGRLGGIFIADVVGQFVYRLDTKSGQVGRWAGDGTRKTAADNTPLAQITFAGPRALAVDSSRDIVYICEREGNVVLQIALKDKIVHRYAGTGTKGFSGDGGPASDAKLNGPKGLCCDRDGNLYIVDTENHAIRCVDRMTRTISTIAGGRKGPEGDGGRADQAGLNRPHGVCIGPDNAVYIADSENHRIRRVELLR